MTHSRKRTWLGVPLFLSLAAVGCSGENPSDPLATGGMAGMAGAAGSAGAAPEGITPIPDPTGWIDRKAEGNTIGIQGAWYPYGDKYGEAKCTLVGLHASEECSTITSPDPLVPGFPNVGGEMCTTGETAVVLGCKDGVPRCTLGSLDYSNMWGAGIGLDLNAEGAPSGEPAPKAPWNPDEHGVVGIAFDINVVPPPGLRVEFPIVLPDATTTENHPDGSPYWGAKPNYPNSDVKPGRNQFRWTEVAVPTSNYAFDRTKILSIQFHVPAVTSGANRGVYSFCVKNLTFLLK